MTLSEEQLLDIKIRKMLHYLECDLIEINPPVYEQHKKPSGEFSKVPVYSALESKYNFENLLALRFGEKYDRKSWQLKVLIENLIKSESIQFWNNVTSTDYLWAYYYPIDSFCYVCVAEEGFGVYSPRDFRFIRVKADLNFRQELFWLLESLTHKVVEGDYDREQQRLRTDAIENRLYRIINDTEDTAIL